MSLRSDEGRCRRTITSLFWLKGRRSLISVFIRSNSNMSMRSLEVVISTFTFSWHTDCTLTAHWLDTDWTLTTTVCRVWKPTCKRLRGKDWTSLRTDWTEIKLMLSVPLYSWWGEKLKLWLALCCRITFDTANQIKWWINFSWYIVALKMRLVFSHLIHLIKLNSSDAFILINQSIIELFTLELAESQSHNSITKIGLDYSLSNLRTQNL